ncbi:MAG TPA: hypothetical protein VHN39_16400 [Phenylobacterium sp.]|jgi:hypothetical protein|nr:hypothetical protein [Phenylobacterium sp.]
MISAVLAATALFFQAAPVADHAAAASSAAPARSVSPVTVTGQGSHTSTEAGGTVVCHDEVRLGSLFPQRICARKDEILDRTRMDQQSTREATNLRPWRDPASGH